MKYLLMVFIMVFIVGCSKISTYKIGISNSSETGIILLEFPVRNFSKVNLRPNNRSASMTFGPFKKTSHRLPDQIRVVWQLAELINCKPSTSTNIYASKKPTDCDFDPIKDEIYEKIIDLRSFQKSKAFSELGETSHRGWPRTNTAKLKIIFTGDDVKITTHQGSTKIWR